MIFEFIKVHKCEEGMMLVTTKSHKYVCNDNLKVSKRKFNRLKRSDNIASPFFLQICTKGLENVKFFVRKKWQKCHHSGFFWQYSRQLGKRISLFFCLDKNWWVYRKSLKDFQIFLSVLLASRCKDFRILPKKLSISPWYWASKSNWHWNFLFFLSIICLLWKIRRLFTVFYPKFHSIN